MDKVLTLRADLPVIDASEGIAMFPSDETHDHDAHAHDEHDELYNAHVWLDPSRAIKQVQNIADGLAEADPAHAAAYQENAAGYIERLTALDGELKAQLAPFAGADIITFHEAFAYFADAYGLHVAGVIANEPGEEPSTRDIADTCDLVTTLGIRTLFVEPQYPQRPPKPSHGRRALPFIRSTRAYPATHEKSYETIMRENARYHGGAFQMTQKKRFSLRLRMTTPVTRM
ncbi:MAG: metal ABC transporter substrate-binding protein [Christensenellales bacterium]